MPDDSGRPDLAELAEERAHERFEHEHTGESEPPPIVPIRGLHYQDETGMRYLASGLTDAPDGTMLVKTTISGQPALVFEDPTEAGGIPSSQKGKPGGVGTLDETGHQPVSESPLSVVSSSQAGGLALLPAGLRSVINITDPKYGCKADNGVTDNGPRLEAAITDAKTIKAIVYAPGAVGAYGFTGKPTLLNGVDLIGDGYSPNAPVTRFLCMNATATLCTGYTEAAGNNPTPSEAALKNYGSITGNFMVDGGNVATQPFLFGRRSQAAFDPIAVVNGAAQPPYAGGETVKPGERRLFEGLTFECLIECTGITPPVQSWLSGSTAAGVWAIVALKNAETVEHSKVVTCESTTNLQVGDAISSTAFPGGTTVTATLTATTVEVSAEATATGKQIITVTPHYWKLRADSAGIVYQEAQNQIHRQVLATNCAGSGVVFDGGTGGHKIDVMEVNACGGAKTWPVIAMESYKTSVVLYAVPTKITIDQPIIERISKGSLGCFLHIAGERLHFSDTILEGNLVGGSYSGVAMVYDGVHVSFKLIFDYLSVALDSENTNCFALGQGTKLIHERTETSPGQVPQYAYLLQTGFRVEEERPEWPESSLTLLNPLGSVKTLAAFEEGTAARHFAPIEIFVVGNGSPQIRLNPSGLMQAVSTILGAGAGLGGATGAVGLADGVAASSNPSGAVLFAAGKVGRYRTNAGTVGTFAGNSRTQEGTYKIVVGDSFILWTVKTKTTSLIELIEAKVFGVGYLLIARTENNAEAIGEIKRAGSDEMRNKGEKFSAANIIVAGNSDQLFFCDGVSKWYGL